MDFSFNTSFINNPIDESKCPDNLFMKLRRLQIEEQQLLKNLKLQDKDDKHDEVGKVLDDSEYMERIFNSCNDIQNLVERIKADTSPAVLKDADLDDIKKYVLELESKKRTFHYFIQTELKTLKREEQELMEEIDKIQNEAKLPRKNTKSNTKVLKQIVSSPVHNLINSPLKHNDVQLFQDFIASSKSRCGGWAPYHHNIFVQAWNKHFSYFYKENHFEKIDILSSSAFSSFTEEIIKKITEVTLEEIISHSQWYAKFLHLKSLQQKAIEKWRKNRKLIKNNSRQNIDVLGEQTKKKSTSNVPEVDLGGLKEMRRRCTPKIKRNEWPLNYDIIEETNNNGIQNTHQGTRKVPEVGPNTSPGYLKPTSQWNNWCGSTSKYTPTSVIQTIPKLRVPDWRMSLKE